MKSGGWLKRSKPLKAKQWLEKAAAPIKKFNAKRKARRHEEEFGPPGFVEFVHSYGCVIAREHDGDWQTAGCVGPVEAAHVKSRGAGGKWKNNIVGLCKGHHFEQHAVGMIEFTKRHDNIDLDLWAVAVTGAWERCGG